MIVVLSLARGGARRCAPPQWVHKRRVAELCGKHPTPRSDRHTRHPDGQAGPRCIARGHPDSARIPEAACLCRAIDRNVGHRPTIDPRFRRKSSLACLLHKYSASVRLNSSMPGNAVGSPVTFDRCYEETHDVHNKYDLVHSPILSPRNRSAPPADSPRIDGSFLNSSYNPLFFW
jgi:hypothetical protein